MTVRAYFVLTLHEKMLCYVLFYSVLFYVMKEQRENEVYLSGRVLTNYTKITDIYVWYCFIH